MSNKGEIATNHIKLFLEDTLKVRTVFLNSAGFLVGWGICLVFHLALFSISLIFIASLWETTGFQIIAALQSILKSCVRLRGLFVSLLLYNSEWILLLWNLWFYKFRGKGESRKRRKMIKKNFFYISMYFLGIPVIKWQYCHWG